MTGQGGRSEVLPHSSSLIGCERREREEQKFSKNNGFSFTVVFDWFWLLPFGTKSSSSVELLLRSSPNLLHMKYENMKHLRFWCWQSVTGILPLALPAQSFYIKSMYVEHPLDSLKWFLWCQTLHCCCFWDRHKVFILLVLWHTCHSHTATMSIYESRIGCGDITASQQDAGLCFCI